MSTYRAGSGSPQYVLSASITPSAVPAGNTSVETFAPAAFGQLTTDSHVYVTLPSLEAGLILDGAFISATGTVKITFTNVTGSTITPAAQTCQIIVF